MTVFKSRTRSLRDLLVGARRFGDAEYFAFTDGNDWRRFTFAEHERLVASTAAVLRDEYGVGRGDRVAILGANSPEWIVTFWATISLGAIAVGLNGWSTGPEIRYGVDDSDPKLLVADARRLAPRRRRSRACPSSRWRAGSTRSGTRIPTRRCPRPRSTTTIPR